MWELTSTVDQLRSLFAGKWLENMAGLYWRNGFTPGRSWDLSPTERKKKQKKNRVTLSSSVNLPSLLPGLHRALQEIFFFSWWMLFLTLPNLGFREHVLNQKPSVPEWTTAPLCPPGDPGRILPNISHLHLVDFHTAVLKSKHSGCKSHAVVKAPCLERLYQNQSDVCHV